MKRSELKRGATPLKRSTFTAPRKPLRKVSAQARAKWPARLACIQIVLERDQGCVFARRVTGRGLSPDLAPTCWGQLDVHEPGHRSQGADPTNPDECVTLCRGHHDYVHGFPLTAKLLEL